jgi:LacI family transcriptional regulator, galactose operon repressor
MSGGTVATQDRQPVTIYDVAQRAGVSIATVSRTLRGSADVAPSTKDKVLAAVAEMGFRPNRMGQSLAEGQHAANGIVFPDLSGPYYAEVLLGYEEVAAELGRSVLILSTHGRMEAARKVLDLAARVDGLVVMGRTVADGVVEQIAASGQPVVLLARSPAAGLDTITADNVDSAKALTEHLLSHGYTRLTYLGDPTQSPDVAGRYAGFEEALKAANRKPHQTIACAFDVQAGYEAAKSALKKKPHVLVCANDEIALGALSAAEDAGIGVPEDVAVTGWDDVMAAQYARLTTVRQPMRELGALAARRLQERIAGSAEPARHHVLTTRPVIRASCGTHTT